MNRVANKGFTLIELMLAMSFISVLLLAIAMVIIQIGTTYNKGMTIKEVNQVSRDIASDIRRNVSAVGALDYATNYVTTPTGGRMCLGSYSYIWNNTKALSPTLDPNRARYQSDTRTVRLVRVPDGGRIYCKKNLATGVLENRDIRTADTAASQELLQTGDRKLGLNVFEILPPQASAGNTDTNQQLYTLHYIIGSGEVDAMTTDMTSCKGVGTAGSDLAYCSVQEFRVVLRAGNRV